MRKRIRVDPLTEEDIDLFFLKIFNQCKEFFPENLQQNLSYTINQAIYRQFTIYYRLIDKVGLFSLTLKPYTCYLPNCESLKSNIIQVFWDQLHKKLLPLDEQKFLLDNIDILRITHNIKSIDSSLQTITIMDFYQELLLVIDNSLKARVESWIMIENMAKAQYEKIE